MKSKEPKKIFIKNIKNPFKKTKRKDFDCSSKLSGISPSSRLKTSEVYKDKKSKRKGSHKRSSSNLSYNKTQGKGRSMKDKSKCIKVFLNNYRSKNKKSVGGSVKNLLKNEAIVNYKDVAKNLEIIRKIEENIKDNGYKSLKNLVKQGEDRHIFTKRDSRQSKQKSFHRPSLSV